MDNEIELDDKGMPVLPANRRWLVTREWDSSVRVALEEFCYSKGMFRREDVYIPLQIESVNINVDESIEDINTQVNLVGLRIYLSQVEIDERDRVKKAAQAKLAEEREKITQKKAKKVDQYLDKYWGRSH